MYIISNYPVLIAIFTMALAQTIKFPIEWLVKKNFNPMIIFSNGGMPSSHSAMVSSLTTAIGLKEGIASSYFAIAAVFALITMWDAAGIRYQASKHAKILNVLVKDFHLLLENLKHKPKWTHTPLKELLGHKPLEVLMGAIFGVTVAILIT